MKLKKYAKTTSQGLNLLCIRGNDITYAEFKTLSLYSFVKPEQDATKLFTKLSKINKDKNKGKVLV